MSAGGVPKCALVVAAALLAIAVAPAHATFPGTNGTIAFTSDRSGVNNIWTMNPDGSRQRRLTGEGEPDFYPAWSPDGSEIAFARGGDVFAVDAGGANLRLITANDNGYANIPAWSPDGQSIAYAYFAIYVIDADGGGTPREVSTVHPPESHAYPDWAPDGQKIVFSRYDQGGNRHGGCYEYGRLTLVDPAGGTTETPLANESAWIDGAPSFSPDGEKLAYVRRPTICYRGGQPVHSDIYTLPVDGGAPVQLTNTPGVSEGRPQWSPDGTKIAFAATEAGNSDIYVMNADGTGRQRLTSDPGNDRDPSWRNGVAPVPRFGFPRPKSAGRIRVPLVPAYGACNDPNTTHGPPLTYGSCAPPQSTPNSYGSPPRATFGTPDANGHPARSTGYVRLTTVTGSPSTDEDEADVRIELHLTDVRKTDDPATGYPFSLTLPLPLRLTDKNSECCRLPGTVRDLHQHADVQVQVEAPCAPAGPGAGATCSVTTTADAVLPDFVTEGVRSIWEFFGPVRVYDSGPDGSGASTLDNGLIASQGLFVP